MRIGLYKVILLTYCTLFLVSCSVVKLDTISLPKESKEVKSTIELGKNFADAEKRIKAFLTVNKYQNFENIVRKIESDTEAETIFKFYGKELEQKGFVIEDPGLDINNTEIRSWKKNNLLNEQIIIVSVIESRHVDTDELTGKSFLVYAAQK